MLFLLLFRSPSTVRARTKEWALLMLIGENKRVGGVWGGGELLDNNNGIRFNTSAALVTLVCLLSFSSFEYFGGCC